MKVPLKIKPERYHPESRMTCIDWIKSLPFYVNYKGLLVHRVKSAKCYLRDGEYSHTSVSFYCANSTTSKGKFVDDPPTDRLLCERCEQVVKQMGLPSADQLTGRHVHVGKVRCKRTCCQEQTESN